MLILTFLSCGPESEPRPRFCVRDVDACEFDWWDDTPQLLDGCPDSEIGACRMDLPVVGLCSRTPGGCAPVEEWLDNAGWFYDPTLFTVSRCRSLVPSGRSQWFTVEWFPVDSTTTTIETGPGDIVRLTWALWFDRADGSMVGAMYGEVYGRWSMDWCCGTRQVNTQVWGEPVDPGAEGDCQEIHPGWPGWSR